MFWCCCCCCCCCDPVACCCCWRCCCEFWLSWGIWFPICSWVSNVNTTSRLRIILEVTSSWKKMVSVKRSNWEIYRVSSEFLFVSQSAVSAQTCDTCIAVNAFIPCHRECSQSEYKRAIVYSTVLHPTFPSCTAHMSNWLCRPLCFPWQGIE